MNIAHNEKPTLGIVVKQAGVLTLSLDAPNLTRCERPVVSKLSRGHSIGSYAQGQLDVLWLPVSRLLSSHERNIRELTVERLPRRTRVTLSLIHPAHNQPGVIAAALLRPLHESGEYGKIVAAYGASEYVGNGLNNVGYTPGGCQLLVRRASSTELMTGLLGRTD
jgi:hypothetical protein